jgi:hypothetical protein
MNFFVYILLGVGLFYFIGKTNQKDKRIKMIDYLNVKVGAKGWSKLSNEDIAKIYAIVRSKELGIQPDSNAIYEYNRVLEKLK